VAESEMPEPRGVRGSRLDRSRRRPTFSGRCCLPITIRRDGSSTPAAPAPASAMPSLNGCGAACNRWRRPGCRLTSRRRATAALDRH
jgi:hypothetical protein